MSRIGKDESATLRALAMPHHRVARHIGAHQVDCESTLTTTVSPGQPKQVTQKLSMTMDAGGRFAATKDTDPQFGQEVVWDGKWLFSRLRHSRFVRRRARDKTEPGRVADRMYGLLPAYVDLLGRFVAVEAVGKGELEGRQTTKVRMKLASRARPLTWEGSPARKWRYSVVARKINGSAELCARTGTPLRADLSAEWDFNPPAAGKVPASGIPIQLDLKTRGRMTVRFQQRLTGVGAEQTVKAPDPSEVETRIRRVRLETERQMLTGERAVSGRVDQPEGAGER